MIRRRKRAMDCNRQFKDCAGSRRSDLPDQLAQASRVIFVGNLKHPIAVPDVSQRNLQFAPSVLARRAPTAVPPIVDLSNRPARVRQVAAELAHQALSCGVLKFVELRRIRDEP
jgi:hypothetical protein